MKKLLTRVSIGLAALAVAIINTQAQSSTTPAAAKPPAPPPSAWDQWVKQAKNPTDWLTWGADVRLRNEYFDNALALSATAAGHEQDYFRFRERLWASVMPVKDVSVNARLAAEQREWMRPAASSQYGARPGFEERYMILDNANVKWNNILDQPLSVSAGRQDILIGDFYDWWLVSDGTPGDGSWTFFLDSIRLGYEAKDIKTKFDVIYIYQNALPDEWIPTLGRSSESTLPTGAAKAYNLTEQNEQGVILYASNKSVKDTQLDGYFIYKRDTKAALFSNGDNADIYTLGSKITGTPAEHWQYSVEGAYQFGHKQDATVAAAYVNSSSDWRAISAYGGKAKLSYLFKDQLNNQVSLVGEFLSGDDPNTTGKDEMFDILWGRWPRWSELYIYSYALETSGKIAQLNNVGRFGPQWTLSPVKNMSFSAMYNALFAPEQVPTRAVAPRFSKNGNFRGHYLQTVLKHQFNKNVSAHLWGELVWQGDYYAGRDLMSFLRAEVMFTF